MTYTFRLPIWLQRAMPAAAVDRAKDDDGAVDGVLTPPADGGGSDAASLDAQVMRRRVQHFCDEFPPSRTRR